MPTVAEIAKEAFDGVAEEMPDVIQAASLTRTVRGEEYDSDTGSYLVTTETWPCRALFADENSMADAFPAYVIGPSDRMVYVEGLTTTPNETDRMVIGGQPVIVQSVGDIVGVGTFFSLIVRNSA